MYYLNKLSGIPLNYPVVKGTVVHEVFGDLLRGMELEDSVVDRVEEAGLELVCWATSPRGGRRRGAGTPPRSRGGSRRAR